VSRYQKGKTNLDFTGARDSEWQWHQLGHKQVSTLLQADTMPAPHHFLQAGCPSCRPTNSVKALKAANIPLFQQNFVWGQGLQTKLRQSETNLAYASRHMIYVGSYTRNSNQ